MKKYWRVIAMTRAGLKPPAQYMEALTGWVRDESALADFHVLRRGIHPPDPRYTASACRNSESPSSAFHSPANARRGEAAHCRAVLDGGSECMEALRAGRAESVFAKHPLGQPTFMC